MLTLRQTPFDLFQADRFKTELFEADLLKQLDKQLHGAERVPAAEVHESPEAYTIVLELPGVDKDSIDVKATDRSLVISAERRQAEVSATPLLNEFRYGTWSRSFRFPGGIEREAMQATYRDGLLSVVAPKAQTLTTVQVNVES